MIPLYVITKNSRIPRAYSYSGPTWDAAGIRMIYKPQYESKVVAEEVAKRLSEFNPIGFSVQEIWWTP
jgi:hypothetical protein